MLIRKLYKKRKKEGQSTVEYIILVAAILAVILVFLGPTGVFQRAYNDTLMQSTNDMNGMAERLFNKTAF